MPDGKTLLAAISVQAGDFTKAVASAKGSVVIPYSSVLIYSSTDNGLTWQVLSSVVQGSEFGGRFTYAGLLLLPSGELHAYGLHIAITGAPQEVAGITNAICLFVSKDGGKTWSEPKPIVGKGGACWKNPGDKGNLYRSPWAMQLDDGRIVVLFGRRRMPMGIGGVVSADGGKTWSEEFVVRDDGVSSDLGYIVGSQLKDGRIFAAYYYTRPDGNKFDGTRYIAGTTFKLR
jgi:Neuraminidase (sialidase)